jgi:simple sugar transport system ATP-binding protein
MTTPTPSPQPAPVLQTQSDVLLRLEGISKTFGGVRALDNVSLELHAGQVYHLLGENGSGKSTLIKIVAGAQPPDSGRIVVRGRSYARLGALEAIRAGIETVYQDLSLFPNLSVAENVALTTQLEHSGGRLARPLSWSRVREIARRALERVGLPSDADFLERAVETLPIAVRQLVAIARGIAAQASLVIMDEPTAALTQREVENLLEIIAGLRREGVSVLFVSHKLEEVFRIGGNVIVLRDGHKVLDGSLADFDEQKIGFVMTGKTLSQSSYRDPNSAPSSDVLLQTRGLRRRGEFADVDLTLHKGEVLGITGLLDSGRNELALALAGVRPADGGEVKLEGQPVQLRDPRAAVALRIGYVPEDRLTEGLFLDKSIRDNIVVTVLDELANGPRLNFKAIDAQAQGFVKDLQIATPSIDLPVQSLSGGNQQRVMVARWLATRPRVLILHGPTAGVDVGSKDALYKLVQRLSQEGMGVIIVSDDLPELLMNTDRILVMKKGRIERSFQTAGLEKAVLTAELLEETRAGAAL